MDDEWPLEFSVDCAPAGSNLPEVQVLTCTGELDMATGPKLREALGGVEDGNLIADLSRLSFIDSTGVSILLSTVKRFTGAGRKLVVVCPTGSPRRVFDLTGLTELLNICDSREQAEARLAHCSG